MPLRRVTSQRHGDFFAEVKETTVDVPSSGGLLVLQQAVRGAHADIADGASVVLHTVMDYEATTLNSDEILGKALEALGDDGILALTFESTGDAACTRGLEADVILVLNDLVAHKEVKLTFSALSSQSALTKLKADATSALGLPADCAVSIGVALEGENVECIPSDRALEQLIATTKEAGEGPLRIIVSVVAQSSTKSVGVKASYAQGAIAASRHAEFPFSFSIDQQGLLASLKDAARGFLEVPTSTPVDLSASIDDVVTPLSSDKVLLNVLLAFAESDTMLDLYVCDSVGSAPTQKLTTTVTQGSTTVTFDFTFSLDDTNVTRALREDCGAELERTLAEDDALLFVDPAACEEALITSDTVLRDILLQLLAADRPLTLVVQRQSKPVLLKRQVKCSMHGETACFEFQFSMNQNNLLQFLTGDAKAELDLMPNDNIVLSAVVDGDAFVLRNDSEVRELFSQVAPEMPIVLEARDAALARTRSKQVVVSTRPVTCTLDDEVAEFQLRYVLSQDGLLEHIMSECKDALDLMPHEDIRISVRVGSDLVVLQSDAETRELFHLTEDTAVLELVASHVISRSHNAVSTVIRKCIRCTLAEETAVFELNFVVSQDGLLDFLDALDLMPNESIRIDAVVEEGNTMPISTDGILREALMREGDLVLTARVGEVRQVMHRRNVLCTLNGDTAEFEFKYAMEEDTLLQHLMEECKAELDLMPNDNVSLHAVIGDDAVLLQSDRNLREVLSHLEAGDGAPLVLRAEEVKSTAAGSPSKAAALLSVTIGFQVTCGDDTQSLCYRFHPEEKEPLNALKCLVRGDFELDPTTAITLMLATDAQLPAALRCDDDVRALVGRTDVPLHVVLPKSEEQLLEEKPLNRTAEINALFYDWRDILTTPTVEASDLQLVTSNLQIDGAPLPPTHPITLRLMAMATDETVLRVDDELLPFLVTLFSDLADYEASRLCHACRDVVEFIVGKSPLFRLRRSLSEAFRTLSIKDTVTSSVLSVQLIAAGVPEEDIRTVLQGYPNELPRAQYNEITEQLFGDCPQDVSEFIAAVTQGRKNNHEGQQEVFQLRRNRLLADIRHAFDGVAPVNLVSLALEDVFRSNATNADLAWCVCTLAGGPHEQQEAVSWLYAALRDETAASNFMHACLGFKDTLMPIQTLTSVCVRLNEADLEPSVVISQSNALHGLVSWALGAARLACHTRRELFPPVVVIQPRPPSARRKAETCDDGDNQDGYARRMRGLSSPYAITRFSNEAATASASGSNDVVVASPTSGDVPRFEPKLRHLSTDLKITDDGPHHYSLRALMAAQAPTLEEHADPEPPVREESHVTQAYRQTSTPEAVPAAEATTTDAAPEAEVESAPVAKADTTDEAPVEAAPEALEGETSTAPSAAPETKEQQLQAAE